MEMYQVDAFTVNPFSGNPAAVCLLDDSLDDTVLQQIAAEMNLSETAFLSPATNGFNLRWFTPATEVDLCGHATLASAHVLWDTGKLASGQPARFHTRSGVLEARRTAAGIELNFPAQPPVETPAPPDLLASLQIQPAYVGFNGSDYLVAVETAETVHQLAPDFRRMEKVVTRGVIVTAPAEREGVDFISRFFAPAVGIDEDPVTGSAHCCLGPYWGARLNKTTLAAAQVSPRGGTLTVQVAGERVLLIGKAVTVMKGEMVF